MDNYVRNVSLDLLLKINNKAIEKIPGITSSGGVEEAVENCGSYRLYLRTAGKREAFCAFEVIVTKINDALVFEVFAEHEEDDFKESKLGKINIENLMSKYSKLKPLITEGIMHLFGDFDSETIDWSKRTAKRTFKVRYRVIDEHVEENEDHTHDFDLDKMSNKSIPYIESMLEIFKVIHPD